MHTRIEFDRAEPLQLVHVLAEQLLTDPVRQRYRDTADSEPLQV